MFGRIVLVLLCLLTLQTNLFARNCSPWDNRATDNGPLGDGCRNSSPSNYTFAFCVGGSVRGSGQGCSMCSPNSTAPYCQTCGSTRSCFLDCFRCTDQCSFDSLRCVNLGDSFNSQACVCVPDTSFKCTSVSTENNVIRSQIDYIVHDSIVKQKYILGSCIENNFCEAGGERQTYTADNPTYAYDSCSFDSVSVQRCKFVGQNGSSCRYVCPDGRNWNCRQVTYSGINIPQCPSVPWKECSDEYVPVKINTPDNALSNDSVWLNVEGSWQDPDYPSIIDALDDIGASLDKADYYNRLRQYTDEHMYDVVGGYGSFEGDGIWQNTKRIDQSLSDVNANIGETNNNLNSVVINQNTIIKHLETDTIRVEVQNDSTKPVWVLPNWEPMVFAIDTNTQKVEDALNHIKDRVDTLVLDTPRTNSILGDIAQKFDNAISLIDSINIKNPLDYVSDYAHGIADSISLKLKPYLDNIFVDSATADSLIGSVDNFSLPSADIDTLPDDTLPFDTIPFDSTFFEDVDSLVRFIDSLNQERLKKDTTIDTLPLDKLSGDSAEIRNKLSNIFLTDVVLNSCFEFHMHPVIHVTIFRKSFTYDLSMVIDFADLFGWDLCEFIRKIVEILTFILIVFTTIKGYIRAFGGSNIGG